MIPVAVQRNERNDSTKRKEYVKSAKYKRKYLSRVLHANQSS